MSRPRLRYSRCVGVRGIFRVKYHVGVLRGIIRVKVKCSVGVQGFLGLVLNFVSRVFKNIITVLLKTKESKMAEGLSTTFGFAYNNFLLSRHVSKYKV